MRDRKKVLKAAAIAAVIIVPVLAAAVYFWPKDIFFYIYGKDDPVAFAITLDGERVIEGSWNGTGRDQYSSPLLYFAKKTVAGPDFELGVSVDGGAPLKARYSAFDGSHFTIYLHEEVVIVQAKAEPPGARPNPQ